MILKLFQYVQHLKKQQKLPYYSPLLQFSF